MKNLFLSVVAFAVLAVVANDSFAGCRSGCGRTGLSLRSRSCNSSCASSCSTAKPAPAAAPKTAAPAASAKVESASACGSCASGSCGLRGRLRLR